jgi:UDP-2,3-diacylglucosamine pyrophosphatase LpxH
MLHYDTLDSVTPTNKHPLDADSRYPKIVEATVRALRRVIRLLLSHHEEVIILMAEGNHDPVSSVWLRELFTALYEDEPRVTVEKSPLPYYCVEHGDTSIFFHHGHLKRPKQIAEVFAAQFRPVLGRTQHSYAHMGHMHHTQVHETPLMIVEQHQTLAAKDAYAARGGWNSQRSAQVISYSKKHGEISRIRIPFSMVKRDAA